MGAGGTARRSLAQHAKEKARKKGLEMAHTIDQEITSTAAIGVARKRANTLPPEDEAGFKTFYISWKDWREKNIDAGAPISVTEDAIKIMERFRAQNTEWTRKFTSVPNAPVVMAPVAAPPPVAKVEEKPSALPWILAMGGIALVGLGLSGGRS